MPSENTRRIAKNTGFLYIRMLLTMGISLYTSRVVLNTLGVEDFGIYSVVGSVIVLFSFLNASMGTATSRFFIFALGQKKRRELNETFSAALTVHVGLALVLLFLGETVGLWFVRNELVIPENRRLAGLVVYQFSLFIAMVQIIQVPFYASVITHEKMEVYAYIEILNVFLKLLIVFFLPLIAYDKLIMYGFLLFVVSLCILFFYCLYTRKNYEECRGSFLLKKDRIFPLLKYSGWDLYGNASVVARTQGVNMLLNIFFGPVLNAASGIASQVQGAAITFAANVLTAIRPQVIKNYACGKREEMVVLINHAALFTYLLLFMVSFPLLLEMRFVLKVWLGIVPEYTVLFCRLTLIFNFVANFSSVVMMGIHATGRIKRSSLLNGSFYLSVLPLTYFLFAKGGGAEIPYVVNVLLVCLGCGFNIYILKKYVWEFSLGMFFKKVILPCFTISVLSALFSVMSIYYMDEGWGRLFMVFTLSCLSVCFFTYRIGLDERMRKKVIGYLVKIIKKYV